MIGDVVIGLDGGLPSIKTEHQEAPSPLEGTGREVATTEFAPEEMPEQFGMPPDLHYQEEMAQALAEGTVGEFLSNDLLYKRERWYFR